MKIGFLGGRFDPVHRGHLGAAQDACAQQQLDRLVFVPAAQAPHKPDEAMASADDRLEMLRLAIESQPRYEISEFELRKGGLSYTVETVRHFRGQFPDDRLFWIIGGDQLARIHRWRGIDELAGLVEFIFLARPGHPVQPAAAIPGLRLHRCDGRSLDVSSTALRDRVKRGLPLAALVPEPVNGYIATRGLYR